MLSTCAFKFHRESHLLQEDISNALSQNEIQPSLNSHSICVDPLVYLDFFNILAFVVLISSYYRFSPWWLRPSTPKILAIIEVKLIPKCNFHSNHSSECPTKTCSLTCMRLYWKTVLNLRIQWLRR